MKGCTWIDSSYWCPGALGGRSGRGPEESGLDAIPAKRGTGGWGCSLDVSVYTKNSSEVLNSGSKAAASWPPPRPEEDLAGCGIFAEALLLLPLFQDIEFINDRHRLMHRHRQCAAVWRYPVRVLARQFLRSGPASSETLALLSCRLLPQQRYVPRLDSREFVLDRIC